MKILAFDTCLDKMYVVLSEDSEILSSKVIETTNVHYHSAFLISTIRAILKDNEVMPEEVNVIATNMGPGSFTGIRACNTVARVFAQGFEAKAVGVSSLEILSKINKTDKKTLVALDARKNMAYTAIYDGDNEILAPTAILLDDVKQMIAENDYFVVTDIKLKEVLGGVAYQENDETLGDYLIKIAVRKLTESCETNWRKLHPLYIQPPPVTVKKVS